MKKILAALLSSAILCSAFTACSPNGASRSNSGTATTNQKINLTYWTTTNRKAWTESAIKAFTQNNPNITITPTYDVVDSLRKNLKVAASSHTLPSMWYNYGGNYFSYFAENGLSYNMTAYAKEHKWKDTMNNQLLDFCTDKGNLGGYPQVLTVFGIIYRKDLFDKYNIAVPTTFDDFEKAMATLKSNGVTPLAIGGKSGWMVMRITDLLIEKYAGASTRDKLYSLNANWNQDAVTQAFTKLKEWSDAGYLPNGFDTMDPNDARLLLYNGKAAMTIDGAPLVTMMKTNGCDFNQYSSFRIPFGDSTMRIPTYVTMVQYNAKLSKAQLDAAVKFTEFTLSKDPSNANMQENPLPYKDAKFPETVPLIQPIMDNFAKVGGFITGDNALPSEVSNMFYQADDSVVGGSMTPKQAAAFMQQKVTEYKASSK